MALRTYRFVCPKPVAGELRSLLLGAKVDCETGRETTFELVCTPSTATDIRRHPGVVEL